MGAGKFPQIPLPLADADRPGFELFRAGHNGEAMQALEALATGGSTHIIYLWGDAGTGKSHLVNAACRAAALVGRRAALVPLSQRGKLAPAMLESLDTLDLVCIDDLDVVAGDADWEQALLHLYNRLRDLRLALVLAARTPPAGSPVTLADLRSRLGWDLVYRLEPLAESERFAALRDRATARGIEIPDEVMEFLARRVARDMHSLFDWLDRLDHASLAAGKRLTVPFVRDLLERAP